MRLCFLSTRREDSIREEGNRLAYVAFAPALLLLLATRDEEIVDIKANDSRGRSEQYAICLVPNCRSLTLMSRYVITNARGGFCSTRSVDCSIVCILFLRPSFSVPLIASKRYAPFTIKDNVICIRRQDVRLFSNALWRNSSKCC